MYGDLVCGRCAGCRSAGFAGYGYSKLSHKYKYTEDMKLTSEIKFVLSLYHSRWPGTESYCDKTIQLENYDYLYYHGLTAEDVLKTVTSGYAGNYTLAWAQSHDYKPEIKTAWVNLKGYKSDTKYLVWVNLTYQRVNILRDRKGSGSSFEPVCAARAPMPRLLSAGSLPPPISNRPGIMDRTTVALLSGSMAPLAMLSTRGCNTGR